MLNVVPFKHTETMSQKFIKSKNNNLCSTAFGKYFAKAVWGSRGRFYWSFGWKSEPLWQ